MSNNRQAQRRAYGLARAVGYDITDVQDALDAEEAAERQADQERQEQAQREAQDDADEAAGNSRGITRAIQEERQRHTQRSLRHSSPGMAEAFQDHDDRRRQEREQNRRRQAPAPRPEVAPPAPRGVHPAYAQKQRDIAAQEAEHRARAAEQWEAQQSDLAIQRAERSATAIEIDQQRRDLRARRQRDAEELARRRPR